MLKQVLHKTFAIGLALLVLVSTVSVTIEKHFCGSFLVDVAVFTEADKCASEAMEIEMVEVTKKPCCKDTIDIIEGQDELQLTVDTDMELESPTLMAVISYSDLGIVSFDSTAQYLNPYYDPPDVIADIQVRDQVFLI